MSLVPQHLIHPATFELLAFRNRATLQRIATAFQTPRRKWLSIIAVLLGLVWLSQAIATIFLRQAADPESLRSWIPAALLTYTAWHLIKTLTRQPSNPFEWTEAEQEWVCAAPLSRPQLISYRMVSIFKTSALKAFCFSIIMIPDLQIWPAGFLGMLLGLICVDLLRVCFELIAYSLSPLQKIIAKYGMLCLLFGLVFSAWLKCIYAPDAALKIASPGGLLFFQSLLQELTGYAHTPIGELLVFPFRTFSEIIVAPSVSGQLFARIVAATLLTLSLSGTVYGLDRLANLARQRQETQRLKRLLSQQPTNSPAKPDEVESRVKLPWRLGGFGTIAWRQLLGAYHYRGTLAVSLGVPVVLCCFPLLAPHAPLVMLLNVVGAAIFYTFVLLPSALMLDFRRDVHRIALLKSLPLEPGAIVLGQLATPVLLCSAFQLVVLGIAVLAGKVVLWQASVALLLLLPVNTMIFAIENFIFLLAPYRRNQEGFEVFLRTILTFSGKSLAFAIGVALTLVWAFLSKWICVELELVTASPVLFGVGIWTFTTSLALVLFGLIVRQFVNFDVGLDSVSEG